jgi:isoleucyl-tRNA synthetase
VALAVNGKNDYVKIKIGNEFLILIKTRLGIVTEDFDIIREFKGKELINKQYEPLYQLSPDANEKAYIVIDGGDEV